MNKIFPNWLTTVLLALLLTFISYKLVVRGVITWQKESAEQLTIPVDDQITQPLLQGEGKLPPSLTVFCNNPDRLNNTSRALETRILSLSQFPLVVSRAQINITSTT